MTNRWQWNTARTWSLALLLAACMFGAIILRRGWVSDDAFITLRTIDNFVNGYGLTWNADQRVQAYTHPLWLFLLSVPYAVTREPVYTTMLLSVALAVAGMILFALRVARTPVSAALGVLILALSRAYTDYSTSGLENVLSHLLLIVFYAVLFARPLSPRRLFLLSMVTALAALNRLDTLLLYLPVLLLAVIELRSPRALTALALGQLPLVAWLLFATFYYGFPLPNTAYAKLSSAIPRPEVIEQGLFYLANSLEFDPITLWTIAAGVLAAIISRDRVLQAIAAGAVLYTLYVLWIGGDFMSGRLLTAPLLAAVVVISRLDLSRLQPVPMLLVFGLVLVIGLSVPYPTPVNDSVALMPEPVKAYLTSFDGGVADERLYYYPATGFLTGTRRIELPQHQWVDDGKALKAQGERVSVQGAAGMVGFYAGPGVHIVDTPALGDPLLARLPPARSTRWRPGHLERAIPEGYLATLESGVNTIADPQLAQLYERFALVTRGSLLAPGRLAEMWRLNVAGFDHLIDLEAYRYPEMIHLRHAELPPPQAPGSSWDAAGTIPLSDSGVQIDLGERSHAGALEVALRGGNRRYELVYLDGDEEVARQLILDPAIMADGLFVHRLAVPGQAQQQGFSTLRLFPKQGRDHSMGHLRLQAEEPLGPA